MPYYDGSWHRYSQSERRKYGERKRQELRDAWHKKWISKKGLKERLWTDAAIREFLKPPKDAGPIKAWLRKDVEKVEKSLGFKSWLELRKAKLIAKGKLDPYPEPEAKSRTPRKPRAAKPLPENVINFFQARKERGR